MNYLVVPFSRCLPRWLSFESMIVVIAFIESLCALEKRRGVRAPWDGWRRDRGRLCVCVCIICLLVETLCIVSSLVSGVPWVDCRELKLTVPRPHDETQASGRRLQTPRHPHWFRLAFNYIWYYTHGPVTPTHAQGTLPFQISSSSLIVLPN